MLSSRISYLTTLNTVNAMSSIDDLNNTPYGNLGDDEVSAKAKVEAVILVAIDAHTRTDYDKFSSVCTDEFHRSN